MHLNKSNLLAGLQCAKRLHLDTYHPELAVTRKSPLSAAGIMVGKQARKAFPGGKLVHRFQSDTDPFEETRKLLDDNNITAIFEAGFQYNDIDIFADVIERDGDAWTLIEVKSSTSLKEDYIDDATIQYLVITASGIAVNRVEIMYLNRDFIYQGDGNYSGLFVREEITDRVIAHKSYISDAISKLRSLQPEPEPVRHVNGYCKRPYPCEFKSYCEYQDAQYPVSWLPNASVVIQKLYHNGIYDIRDIPANILESETHLRVRRITISGKPELDNEAVIILNNLDYPRYYIDFETINFAVPVWTGTGPNQQHPFQWSCHIQSRENSIAHKDFLDVSGNDPRRKFAETLIKACGTSGPVIVYNQTFEKGVINKLAMQFNDLSEQLHAINERVFDLLPVIRKYYYHPDMKGSWSIKNVLGCLVPELKYSDLGDVQDGLMAQSAYHDIAGGKLASEQQSALASDLREYCKLDTYAMLAITERICQS
jgi:hypothetical protein